VANAGPTALGGIPGTPGSTGYFWDNPSYDASTTASKCNVGYFLNGTQSGCAASTQFTNPPFPGTNLSFLAANVAGTADVTNMTFSNSAGDNATFRAAFTFNNGTGTSSVDEFGWYLLSSPAALNPLFNTGALGTTTATFTPGGNFGYYLKNGATVYLSGTDGQQFALFAGGGPSGAPPTNLGSYWIGVEDSRNTNFRYSTTTGDYDYQDMIIQIQAVPEPGYIVLLLAGFAGLAFFARRRQSIV